MSFLDHIGLGKLDPHHNLDKIKHGAEDVAEQLDPIKVIHEIEEKVEEFVHDAEKQVVHGANLAVRRGRRALEKELPRLVEKAAKEAARAAEKELEKVAAEIATHLLREGLELFTDLLHDAIPDEPQWFRMGPFKFVWNSIDGRLDEMIAFAKHPPHGVEGLASFVHAVRPDKIRVNIEGRAAAVLASSNVLGAESEVTIDINKFEHVAGKCGTVVGLIGTCERVG